MAVSNFALGDLQGQIDTINAHLVKYGTFATDSYGAIDLLKADYIALSASLDNYVLITYTSPSTTKWHIRQINNSALTNTQGITVAYIAK